MNPEKQRIAIAEACPDLVAKHEHGPGYVWNRGPLRPFDPLNDLHAMHEAEAILALNYKGVDYASYLQSIVSQDEDLETGGDIVWGRVFDLLHATAAQRAEAFLRTIGKWEDA